MIRLEVIDEDDQHIIIRANEPVRIETSVVYGNLTVHGYRGYVTDPDQDPDFVYDGNNEENKDIVLSD